ASVGISFDLFAAGDADQRLAEIDAAFDRIHRFPDAGVRVDVCRAGVGIIEIVEHESSMPGEMAPKALEVSDHDRMGHAAAGPGASTDPLRAGLVAVNRDEASLLKHRLGHAERAARGLLNEELATGLL